MFWFQVASFLLLTLIGARLPAATNPPLQPEDLLSTVQIPYFPEDPVVVSPDGKHVAYVTATPNLSSPDTPTYDPRGAGHKQLWVIPFDGGTPVRVGSPGADNWAPSWSPNGALLAFYSGAAGKATAAIWDVRTRLAHTFGMPVDIRAPVAQWLSDSKRLLISVAHLKPQSRSRSLSPSSPEATASPKIFVLTSTPPPLTQTEKQGDVIDPTTWGDLVDLSLVDAKTGKVSMVVRNARPTMYKPSPDSTKLLVATETGEVSSDINDRVIFDLSLVDLRSGASSVLVKGILTAYNAGTLSWSHDGSQIAFVGGNLADDSALLPGYGTSFPGHLYVIQLARPQPVRRVSDRLLSRVQGSLLWSDDDRVIYATDQDNSEANRTIYGISVATGQERQIASLSSGSFNQYPALLYQAGRHCYSIASSADGAQEVFDFDLASGQQVLASQRFQKIWWLTLSGDGSHISYAGEDAAHPQDVWVTQNSFTQVRQVTHLNPQIESRARGVGQTVSWQTQDGRTFQGTLLLPAGYQSGRRYPMIVFVYAGQPEGTEDRNTFGSSFGEFAYLNLQLYASRGYAVFIPNSELRVGTPMQDIAAVILPGVDKIVAMGIADPDRLGVMGQSYGGYSTMSLIVQTNRFKAAVATSGIYDIFSFYGTMSTDGSAWTSWSESEQGRMGGTPWQYRERYIENSPFFFLDRVNTPVLLEYGSEDKAAAINADEAFVGLRRLGKEATLVRYEGEDHVLIERSNQIDFSRRIFDWFGDHLLKR